LNPNGSKFARGDLRRFVIQEMERSNLGEVVALATSSKSNPWTKNMFIAEMLNPLSHCFVVKNEEVSKNLLAGFICFRNIEDESELLNICVRPQYRRLGIGKKLMHFYMGFSIKIKTFYLEVDSLNLSAIHLYQLFSYQAVGIRKKFYRGKFDALLMAKRS
jgi:ribosomal-protein-alanine N-acetyltransferase